MSIGPLPLSYCTNVHPGRSVAEVDRGLDTFTLPVQERYSHRLAAGLWLAQPVVRELLASPDGVARFADGLHRRGLSCHTLNAFPFGDFHSDRVKENVYIPNWSQPERLQYTVDCARILAALLPEQTDGSISTVPLGFKPFKHQASFVDDCIERLIELARELDRLHAESGRVVRLAIEPEPFCLLETTAETISFFERLRSRAAETGALEVVNGYLGVCYDVCHQSVEFEDVARSIRDLDDAGIRINKVHITCAIELNRPGDNPEARDVLARYVEPRYLHQTMALTQSGEVLRAVDLSEELASHPEPAFLNAETWRVHFHVPVNAERLGPLGTTRADLKRALVAVSELDYAPHLEVETYTWEVLPAGTGGVDLVAGLTRELTATRALLDELALPGSKSDNRQSTDH